MKSNILITGGNGYIASALKRELREHNVTAVTRKDFDITDSSQTKEWFSDKLFDVVIHTAITGGSRLKPDTAEVLDNNIKMYYNLLNERQHYSRFINIGSGAELYRTDTPYGLSKHIIRQSMLPKDSFYNIRVFAVFDENELETRFIKSNLCRYINNTPIRIQQNKQMDFFYMKDFVEVMRYFIVEESPVKEFDCRYSTSPDLKQIASYINTLSDYSVDVIYENPNDGYEHNYIGQYTPINVNYVGLYNGINEVYKKLICN